MSGKGEKPIRQFYVRRVGFIQEFYQCSLRWSLGATPQRLRSRWQEIVWRASVIVEIKNVDQ